MKRTRRGWWMLVAAMLWLSASLAAVAQQDAPAPKDEAPAGKDTAAPAKDAPAQALTVAVFSFQAKDKEMQDTGDLLAELTRTQLSGSTKMRLVSRDEIDKILAEQKLSPAGITDEAAPRIGKLLGAQVLVLGRLFNTNGTTFATVKVIGVETSRVYGEMVKGEKADVEKMATELAGKIESIVDKGADTLVSKAALPQDQIAEIRKRLGDGKFPRVFIHVAEQVVQRPVIDPAAQTEISILVGKIGCDEVKDRDSGLSAWAIKYEQEGEKVAPPQTERADIAIVGQAVSEFGTRTGDLVSCRARVELMALDIKTGKVIATDRETQSGVDLAESVAAKTAIQNATSKMAMRFLPDMVEGWRKGAK